MSFEVADMYITWLFRLFGMAIFILSIIFNVMVWTNRP